MNSHMDVRMEVADAIKEVMEDKSIPISEDLALIGESGVLDSMKLVELCLLLEDKAQDAGFEFDWTSNLAMSKSRSMFRTAGALASEFTKQMHAQR